MAADEDLAAATTPAAALAACAEAHLAAARGHLESLRGASGSRTLDNTLVPYDEIAIELDAVGSLTSLLERVHPDPEVRTTAEKRTQEVARFATALSLDRGVYEA